jgi:Na+/H+-dicarboxylate symporter/ABC-type amino acid transport substrate-binding protein
VPFRFFAKLSSFQKVLFGLLLGVITGIFVGEPAGRLEVVGNTYVRLLQMTVLPYLLASIVGGLGRLKASTAARIGIRAAGLVLFLWLATMLTNLLLPLAYPDWQAASFFSSSMVESGQSFDFITLYIPSNVFNALSNTIVPAVVLFSLLLGVAFIQVDNKDTSLLVLGNISDALMKMASFVAKLAPYGIFAISASAAGTLQPEDLGRLQVFLWAYLVMWLLLAFIAMPLFVSWGTPFRYGEMRKLAGEAMITAFATGTVLVVLPMIAERCKELLASKNMDSEDTESVVAVMVPTAYSFPSVGTLMGLGFILFSGWYLGSPLSVGQYPSYVIMGTMSAFGSMAVAIPFMLDLFNLSADQFQLYLLGSVVTARFATAMAALHGFVICLLVASSVLNRLNWRRLLQALGLHLGIAAVAMWGLGLLLGWLISYDYTGDKSFETMRLMGTPAKVAVVDEPTPLSPAQLQQSRLEVIRQRGTLRVGYGADELPYAYRNDKAEVVGFDLEIMHALARDLDVTLEIHRIDARQSAAMLADGRIDVKVGGVIVTPDRATTTTFTLPYMEHTMGFLVSDQRREEFKDLLGVIQVTDLHLAMERVPYYRKPVAEALPHATVIEVDNPRAFLRGEMPEIDAMIFSAEVGSAWTLLYPDYSIVVPDGIRTRLPVSFGLPQGQSDYLTFMNTWLLLKEQNGFRQKVYDYWILGQNPAAIKPRWSVLRDVLGWTE